MTRRSATGTGVLVAATFFLMQLAWQLTMPAATGIDEVDHIYRAASVASGHWGYSHEELDKKTGRGALIPVPKDVVAAANPACKHLTYVGPANCTAYDSAGGDLVRVACAAARYNPLFYAAVGYPSSWFRGATALAVMRLVTALLTAAMLGLAAVAVRAWARTGWPMLGLFVAATPTVIYAGSIAAPNGLNIASGLALWAALLGLVHAEDRPTSRRLPLTICAIAAVTLVNTHTLGVLWLGLIVVAIAIHRGSWSLPRIAPPMRRAALLSLAATVAGVALAMAWVLVARTNSPWDESATPVHATWWHLVLTAGIIQWPLQAIGAFPMRDQPAPLTVYAIGVTLMLSLASVAVLSLVRRRRGSALLAIAFVAVLSLAVPITLTAMSFSHLGLAWQGRYEMPFTGGLLLLFAIPLDRTRTRLPATVASVVVGLLALMNLLSQLGVIGIFEGTREAAAIGWHPPSTLVLASLALGYAVIGAVAVRSFAPVSEGQAASAAKDPESDATPEPAQVPVP